MRSPSGVRSSASATRDGATDLGHRRVVDGSHDGVSPSRGGARGRSGRQGGRRGSGTSVRAWAPRLSSRACRGSAQRSRHRRRGCATSRLLRRPSPAAGRRAASAAPAERDAPSAAHRRRSVIASLQPLARSIGAPRVVAEPGSKGNARPPMTPTRHGRSPRSTARMAPVGVGPVDAAVDGLDHPRARRPCRRAASSTPAGWRPCTPLQAASPAAHSPGSDVAPSRSVTTPPQQVVGGGRDRQPVGGRVEADLAPARRRSSGTARRSCSSPVASSHTWSTPCSSMRAVIARLTLVARQQLVDEPLAVARRAAARRGRGAPRRAAVAAWRGGAARSGGTARTRRRRRRHRRAAPWRCRRRWPRPGSW